MGAVMDLSLEEIFAEIGGQPNSCSLEEYYAWARHIQSVPSCRFLVFGVGLAGRLCFRQLLFTSLSIVDAGATEDDHR